MDGIWVALKEIAEGGECTAHQVNGHRDAVDWMVEGDDAQAGRQAQQQAQQQDRQGVGVPQGGAMSSALFNMVGPPEAVIAAILDIRERYAAIGLSLALTTSSKNVLYGLGNEYTDQQRESATAAGLHWLPPNQGLEIGGSPVGSPQYMSFHLNKCVDGIIAELTRFEGFINAPAGSHGKKVCKIRS